MKRKYIKPIITYLLIPLTYGYIGFRIYNFIQDNSNQFETLQFNSDLSLLTLLVLLALLNWSIEIQKWRYISKDVLKLSFLQSVKGFFMGVTMGTITPKRIGDICGRVLVVSNENRQKLISPTIFGSMSQLVATLIFGLLSFIFILLFIPEIFPLPIKIAAGISILVFPFFIWIYFTPKKSLKFVKKLFKKIPSELFAFQTRTARLSITLLMSCFRYLVFTSQFIILLSIFDVEINIPLAFITISLIYLVLAVIPTGALTEIGIRGSVSLYLLGIYSLNSPGILFATFSLWFLNIAIPSVIGSFIYYSKSEQYS